MPDASVVELWLCGDREEKALFWVSARVYNLLHHELLVSVH